MSYPFWCKKSCVQIEEITMSKYRNYFHWMHNETLFHKMLKTLKSCWDMLRHVRTMLWQTYMDVVWIDYVVLIYFRYLCEFTYFTSLNIDNLRTIFIHVPELNNPYSAADLAAGIKAILRVLIKKLRAERPDLNNEVCSVNVAWFSLLFILWLF